MSLALLAGPLLSEQSPAVRGQTAHLAEMVAFREDESVDDFDFGILDDDFDEEFDEDFEVLPDDDLDDFGYPDGDISESDTDDGDDLADPFDDFDDLEADENTFDSD